MASIRHARDEMSLLFGEVCGKKESSPDYEELSVIRQATTYSPTIAVPSALAGLTSLFGMGRGGTPPL